MLQNLKLGVSEEKKIVKNPKFGSGLWQVPPGRVRGKTWTHGSGPGRPAMLWWRGWRGGEGGEVARVARVGRGKGGLDKSGHEDVSTENRTEGGKKRE